MSETLTSLKTRWLRYGIFIAALTTSAWWVIRNSPPGPAPESPPQPTLSEMATIAPSLALCSRCHVEEVEDYQSSGHAKTFWSTLDFPYRERFEGLKYLDADRQKELRYFLTDSGVEVVLPSKFNGERFPLQFAFGSGQHAITFVSLTPDGSGEPVGVEHRVSWFTAQERVGLTPGQQGQPIHHDIEYFGKVIRGATLERCFECHTTSAKIVGDRVANLIPNVGCENCHAGGAGHAEVVQNSEMAGTDFGFRHRPWRTANQIQICAQCHRGEHSVNAEDVTRENSKLVRFQPVGLVQSECYVRSGRNMTCTTCHDPHQHATHQSSIDYERRCLECHSRSTQVTCPVSSKKNCISCHMPRIEVHPSISFHDHWIRVRNELDPPAVQNKRDAGH